MPDFFSDWGYSLKLITAMAATIFGIFGVGAKTRDDRGKLTHSGWIALAGIIVTGILAIGASTYEFSKARITGEVTLNFGRDVPAFAEYREMLRNKLPRGRKTCEKTPKYDCGDPEDDETAAYAISPTSPLYPTAPSTAAKFLNDLSIQLTFVKETSPKHYKNAGGFTFKATNEGVRSIVFNPDTSRMEFTLKRFTVPDTEPIKSDIYSLVELFPGFITAGPATIDTDICANCSRPMSDVTIKELILKFPFPKSFRFGATNDFLCQSKEHGSLVVLMLPNDIENLDRLGNRSVIMHPESYKNSLCAEIDNPSF